MSARKTYMAVARFRDGVTPEEIRALIPAEQARVATLAEQGAIGDIKVAMPKRTVFLELYGENEELVNANLNSLPLNALWDAELFETTPPAGANP